MENNNLMISKKMDIFWAVSMLNKTNKDARIMIDGLNNKKLYMNFQSGIASNLIEMIETIEDKPSYCINIDPGLKTLNGLPNLPESCDIVKDKISKNIQVHNFTNRLAIARFPYIYDKNNNVVKIPTPRVTEKPFTGPDPMKKSIIAANKVVILASIIAVLDFV